MRPCNTSENLPQQFSLLSPSITFVNLGKRCRKVICMCCGNEHNAIDFGLLTNQDKHENTLATFLLQIVEPIELCT